MKVLEKTREYQDWFNSLQDKQVKARILVRIDRCRMETRVMSPR